MRHAYLASFLRLLSQGEAPPEDDDLTPDWPAEADVADKLAMYNASTLSLAQGVLRKNFSDDLIEGSFLKQLMLIRLASPSHPKRSTS